MRFSNVRIGYRLFLVVLVGVLGFIGYAAVSLAQLHQTLLADRQSKIQEHVEIARTMVEAIASEAVRAGRSNAEAQREAREALSRVRYEGHDYFWVNDMAGTMLMDPADHALVGKNLLQVRDCSHLVKDATGKLVPAGKLIFPDMIDVVRKHGGGFYHYTWSNDLAKIPPRPKVSYVAGVPQWGWVIGTGVWVTDVDKIFRQQAIRLATLALLSLLVGIAMSIWITTGVAGPLRSVSSELTSLADGRVDIDIVGEDRGDEIGAMARALVAVREHLVEIADVADEIASGNLTVEVRAVSQHDRLGLAIKAMLERLSGLVADAAFAAKAVHTGATTIAESVENQSVISSELSASVAEITSTMEELSASSSHISEHSGLVADTARVTWESSKKGAEAMEQLSGKMAGIHLENQNNLKEILALGDASKEISKVMAIINAIADQTKLIAFNAALEAASAGDAGRRFGVVAAEIRRLADNVTDSTSEIEGKVNQIQGSISRLVITSERGTASVVEGMTAASQSAERLGELVDAARKTAGAAEQISLSTQQQKTAASQVVVALREIVSASNQTAEGMAQLSEVSRNMASLSSDLDFQVDRFRVSTARPGAGGRTVDGAEKTVGPASDRAAVVTRS